jgi:hypothetical protein
MKITGVILFICLFQVLTLPAQINSRWAKQPITIDGNSSEWREVLNFYDTKTQLLYGVINDSTNLYLCLQEPDQMHQMRLMRAGLTVNLSVKGQSKHNVTIIFPIKNQDAERTTDKEKGQRPDMSQLRDKFLLESTKMSIKGFATPDGVVPSHNNRGLNVAVNWDSTGRMNYEIAIPWSELIKTSFSAAELSNDISFEVAINALQPPKVPQGQGKGGKGGKGGGNRGGGGYQGGGGNYNRGALFAPMSFKQKVHVATPQ